MKVTVVIMAGGKGERFWPRSRQNMPKQFLSLTGDGKTMIQLTAERALNIANINDIFILTNETYNPIVREQLPEIPAENIINEPVAKNTAPCLAVAAAIIEKKYGDALMVSLPADHLIGDDKKFIDIVNLALAGATHLDSLITLGIKPDYPETGYGYINYDKSKSSNGLCKVKKFVEKPDKKTAEKYLEQGDYLWNSGMFVWRTSTVLDKIKTLMAGVYEGAKRIGAAYGTPEFSETLSAEFIKFPSVSIDYGIMEKTPNILTALADFGWNDVGSWTALENINSKNDDGNVTIGECVALNSSGCIFVGGKRLIAALGLKDIIVVDTPDAVLIARKEDAQNIKNLISKIKSEKNEKYS